MQSRGVGVNHHNTYVIITTKIETEFMSIYNIHSRNNNNLIVARHSECKRKYKISHLALCSLIFSLCVAISRERKRTINKSDWRQMKTLKQCTASFASPKRNNEECASKHIFAVAAIITSLQINYFYILCRIFFCSTKYNIIYLLHT